MTMPRSRSFLSWPPQQPERWWRSAQAVVHSALNRVLIGGVLPVSASDDPGDPGLLGPDSVSWRVLSDPSSLIGGVRALLLQACHPLAMQGVSDHSAFREDPLGRLQRTVSYVAVMTFGSVQEATTMAHAVNAAHRHVRGVTPDGRAYSADDPDLKLWVHCTLTESFLAAWQQYGPRKLTPSDADRFVSEQADTVAFIGVLDAPRSVAELSAALTGFDEALQRTPATVEAVKFMFRPPLSAAITVPYQVVFWAAVATLEDKHRDVLLLPKVPPARVVTRTLGRAFTVAWRSLIPIGDIRRAAEARVIASTPSTE
jgi:uncharacterized protein (DUF2236 family)